MSCRSRRSTTPSISCTKASRSARWSPSERRRVPSGRAYRSTVTLKKGEPGERYGYFDSSGRRWRREVRRDRLRGRYAHLQVQFLTRDGESEGQYRVQSRLWLHQVLETQGGAVLDGRGHWTRQAQRQRECAQAQDRRRESADPALCVQRLRRAHVRADRKQKSPLLWLRFSAHRAVEGQRLVGSRVRGVRLLDHRVGLSAGAHGRGARAPQGIAAPAPWLPFTPSPCPDRPAERARGKG